MTMGPVQILAVGFENGKFTGEVLEELKALREHNIVRLVDLLFVQKREDGEIEEIEISGMSDDERREFGAVVGALIGYGAGGEQGAEQMAGSGAELMEHGSVFDDQQVWYIADQLPVGVAVGIAVLEHHWAIPLRDAIARAGGVPIFDEWVHASDLIAIGLEAAAEADGRPAS